MTFTFDSALGTSRDRVRAYVGDTVDAGHRVENETIAAVLVSQPNAVLAAAVVADMIAALFAGKADKQIGKTRIDHGAVFSHYRALAASLREMGSDDGAGITAPDGPEVGGISEAKRDDLIDGDSDRIQPAFRLGQDDELEPEAPTRFERP